MSRKDEYIRQVRRTLSVSPSQKTEILRDLEEAFSSGREHGETEEQVAERLGAPREFAACVQEQLESPGQRQRRHRQKVCIGVLLFLALSAFAFWFYLQSLRFPTGVIGQANAMTFISVSGPAWDLLPMILLPLAGLAALAAAIFFVLRYFRGR